MSLVLPPTGSEVCWQSSFRGFGIACNHQVEKARAAQQPHQESMTIVPLETAAPWDPVLPPHPLIPEGDQLPLLEERDIIIPDGIKMIRDSACMGPMVTNKTNERG